MLSMEILFSGLKDLVASFPVLGFLLLLCLAVGGTVVSYAIAESIKKVRDEAAFERRKEELQKKAQKVLKTSPYLHVIRIINRDLAFVEKIPDEGLILFVDRAMNKSQFDRANTQDLLETYIEDNISQLSVWLQDIEANRRIANSYSKKIRMHKRDPGPELLESVGLHKEEYVAIEEKIAKKLMIPIVTELRIKCELVYSSPQGRNRYAKSDIFEESEIRVAIQDLEKKRIERQSESFQKKEERGKMNDGLRYNILRRDGFRCRLCGRTAQDGVKLEVDHIIPISRGGKTTYDNLQTLCKECNRGKGAKMDDYLKEV